MLQIAKIRPQKKNVMAFRRLGYARMQGPLLDYYARTLARLVITVNVALIIKYKSMYSKPNLNINVLHKIFSK